MFSDHITLKQYNVFSSCNTQTFTFDKMFLRSLKDQKHFTFHKMFSDPAILKHFTFDQMFLRSFTDLKHFTFHKMLLDPANILLLALVKLSSVIL